MVVGPGYSQIGLNDLKVQIPGFLLQEVSHVKQGCEAVVFRTFNNFTWALSSVKTNSLDPDHYAKILFDTVIHISYAGVEHDLIII
jgi:hypothetical protein